MADRLLLVQQLRNAIKDYMSLDDTHCYIYNGKWQNINDKNLYLVVGINGEDTISNNLKYTRTATELISTVIVSTLTSFYFDFFSYTTEARARRLEVLSFFNSDKVLRDQESFGYSIESTPTDIKDLSTEEGNKILNRFRIDFTAHQGGEFTKVAPYWDELSGLKTIIND